ncbi:hypothetical protein A8C56_04435 [Niabella ginsenosidivorans]|uniref:AB hydrolase-1 domain-containing protein n=1 Tax=Niabella ginsenosidivorans TaxID=1176587 RepID=A0A1A9HY77_9BACT|nr:alpha/beta hydrolase [Niabella ginsenosidivorans]ANH80326.1 hypothetical protein A8C56_04435 [Niabella ginsenosidivorans]
MLFNKIYFLLLLLTLECLGGNSLRAQDGTTGYKEQELDFTANGNRLSGKLITPHVYKGKLPVIVFVHGSGPEDYSSSGNYRYLWQVFTKMGFACYSWNRPGVSPSEGQWYQASIADRAGEVVSAMNRLKELDLVDSSKIGLWGISQAGWVIPEVAGRIAPAFVITVSSPVTTAFSQECYRVRSQMKAAGFSRRELRKAIAYNKELRAMIKEGKPYQAFLELQKRTESEKWKDYVITGDERVYDYLKVVLTKDSAPDLSSLRCPVLAIWGANDLLVPPQKSAETYKKELKRIGNLNVQIRIIPDADHTLTYNRTGTDAETNRRREQYKDKPWEIFAPGYISLMTDWLKKLDLK